jgi:hypothetical protein
MRVIHAKMRQRCKSRFRHRYSANNCLLTPSFRQMSVKHCHTPLYRPGSACNRTLMVSNGKPEMASARPAVHPQTISFVALSEALAFISSCYKRAA